MLYTKEQLLYAIARAREADYTAYFSGYKLTPEEAEVVPYFKNSDDDILAYIEFHKNHTTKFNQQIDNMTKAKELGITEFPYVEKDKRGNVTYTEYANGEWSSQSYDDCNRIISATGSHGTRYAYTYDVRGNQIQFAISTSPNNYSIRNRWYDENNRMIREIVESRSLIEFEYDSDGRSVLKSLERC